MCQAREPAWAKALRREGFALTSDQTAEQGVGVQSIRWDRASSGQASSLGKDLGPSVKRGRGQGARRVQQEPDLVRIRVFTIR